VRVKGERAARTLTVRKNGRIVSYGSIPPGIGPAVGYWGGAWFDARGNFTGDSRQVREAVTFVNDMRNKYKVAPSAAELPNAYRSELEFFMTGRLAMLVASSWTLSTLKDISAFEWDLAPVPVNKDGERKVIEGSGVLVVYNRTKYPRQAWEFVKFAAYGPGAEILAGGKLAIPADKLVAERRFSSPDKNYQAFYKYIDEFVPSSARFTWFSAWQSQVLYPELDKVRLNMISADKAIESIKVETKKFKSNNGE